MRSAPLVALVPPDELVEEYVATLAGKAGGTIDAYGRILRQLTQWIAARPGHGGRFRPETFTRTALETYLSQLEAEGYSISHRARVKSVAGGFARWLIEEKDLLRRNPARGVEIPAQSGARCGDPGAGGVGSATAGRAPMLRAAGVGRAGG